MISTVRLASVAAASAVVFSLSSVPATAVGGCVSGAQVRAEVHGFVEGLRDDVTSRPARSDLAAALVATLHTYRGVDADTAAERRALGEQIAALVQERRAADSRLERAALRLEIKALTEQRERGAFTATERAAIREAVDAVNNAVAAKSDTRAEGNGVAMFFRQLIAQYGCRPARP